MRQLFIALLFFVLGASVGFAQDLEKVEAKLEEARWLNEQAINAIDEAEQALRSASVPVTNLDAEFTSRNVILVTFTNNTDEPFDIQYYAPEVHDEWQHSIGEYIGYVEPGETEVRIGVGTQADWLLRATQDEWVSDPIAVPMYEEVTPEKTEKKITVIESNKTVMNTPVPNGLIRHDGKYRLYFFERNNGEMLYAESNDLESWTSHRTTDFNVGSGANFVQDEDGDVYLYAGEGDDLYMYDVIGDDLDRLANKRLAYSWRIDGKLTMTIHDGTWYATGRVRGSGPKDEGGWDDDLPDYPDLDELPYIKQEYEEHLPSYRNPDDYIKDRRGISLHTSTNGTDWSDGQIIADPKNYDQKSFRGWMKEGADGIGDFYSSLMIDGERMIIKAYMKEKDRVVDRWEYDPDMRIERRFRFTGETILIPGVYRNGQVDIVSTESIIPREYHNRKTPDEAIYATCPECVEVGQLNNGNEVVFLNGYVYITYGYRDDVHYEAPGFNYYTGVYLYRIPEDQFNNLFN